MDLPPEKPVTSNEKSVPRFVDEIRNTLQTPVNVIEGDDGTRLPDLTSTSLEKSLGWLLTQTRNYRHERLLDRHLVYPTDAVWDTQISGVQIRDIARIEAASRYAAVLRANVAGLHDFAGPVIKGDPGTPLFTDPVSLSPDARVVEHLVELLGQDQSLAFTVERASTGARVLHFSSLTPPTLGPSALSGA